MSSSYSVLADFLEEMESSRPAALCVVVEKMGSAPQVPGAMMMVDANSQAHGTIGGGCVEATVRRDAFHLLQQRESRLIEVELDHETATEDGMVCGGAMKIAVMTTVPADVRKSCEEALRRLYAGQPADFPIRIQEQSKDLTYVLHLEPDPKLIIAGGGHIGQEVAKLGLNLGFQVTVIDNRADFANPFRFPYPIQTVVGEIGPTLQAHPLDAATYLVIVTRGHKHDQAALEAVIRSSAKYIGMIGSRRKVKLIFDSLKESGIDEGLIAKVRAPIGVAIHAVTVQEIAISIIAELIKTRREGWQSLVEGPISS